jgi:tetratricopeptide (TPR) repeat protein
MDADYEQRLDTLLLSIIDGRYDEALAQYWHLLYYTGTRELWRDRDFVSNRLIKACKEEGDLRSLGLITIKGLAWPQMYKNHFPAAKRLLHDGMTTLVKAKAQNDIGVFYEYMADIASDIGDVPSANGSYDAALSKVTGADSYRIELKKRFANVRHERLGCKRRVDGLFPLIEGFRTIKSYQEGIVQIELARSYHYLRSPEAIVIAEEAYELLHDNVMMPRSAGKAKQLIREIHLDSHTRR